MSLPRVRIRSRRAAVASALLGLFTTSCLVLLAPGDPWVDLVLSQVFGHDTRYAPGYREGRWWALHRGMTASQVEATIGPPLEKLPYDGGREFWRYSDSPCGSDHWMRGVSFRGGVAEEFRSGFYLD